VSTQEGSGAQLGADVTRLTLPAAARYARVARLTVAGLASRSGFSYDDVEDIRIAVGEVYSLLVAADADHDDDRITLACSLDDDTLTLVANRASIASPLVVGDLSRQILEAVTDAVSIDEAAATIRITKLLRE
jgi:hypothetical protein